MDRKLISKSIPGATCDIVKLSAIKGAKYIDRIMPTDQVLKVYNASTLRPFGKCKIQVTTPMDRRKIKVPFTIGEDERCVNLIGSKTAQQMQLIAFRDEKIKTSCPEVAELANSASVNVNLTCSQTWGAINHEHICSELGSPILEPLCSSRSTKMLDPFSRH